jgi:hypothetical protein
LARLNSRFLTSLACEARLISVRLWILRLEDQPRQIKHVVNSNLGEIEGIFGNSRWVMRNSDLEKRNFLKNVHGNGWALVDEKRPEQALESR